MQFAQKLQIFTAAIVTGRQHQLLLPVLKNANFSGTKLPLALTNHSSHRHNILSLVF